MNTQASKINIIQRILTVEENVLLGKIAKLLDEHNVAGYNIEGSPILEKKYIVDIHHDFAIISGKKKGS